MIGAILLAIILYLVNQGIFRFFKSRHKFFSVALMNKLYIYHLFFVIVYYIYAYYNPSDSKRYYNNTRDFSGEWTDLYGAGTTFIDFLTYPLIHFFSFSYEASMILFGWLGYIGFIFTYLFFRENIPVKIKLFQRWDFLIVMLFLPNMHFWTSSLGKGSIIFFGIMMFVYAVKFPKKRWLLLLFGSLIVYYVRPHVFMFLLIGVGLGFMSGNKRISLPQKIGAFVTILALLFAIQDDILAVLNIGNSDDIVGDFEDFAASRSEGLSEEAGSGVDMASYSLPFKLFTFWFRPLFIDAPGLLGFIVSAENFLYLLITIKVVNKEFISFLRKSVPLVKMSFIIFLTTSFAMTFVMSNLGIIMRQKSMVMYFFFFVVYYFLAEKKYNRIVKLAKLKKRKEQMAKQSS